MRSWQRGADNKIFIRTKGQNIIGRFENVSVAKNDKNKSEKYGVAYVSGDCVRGQFSVAFEKGENGSFFGSMWDNAVGERMTIGYIWDEAQKKYVESESPDTAL